MADPSAGAERLPLQVAILDDHQVMRDGLTRILDGAGLQVACSAGDPQQFLAGVARTRPAVALMDLRYDTPGTVPDDGRWVLCLLRRRHPQVRPIVLSVLPASEAAGPCARLGAWGYLCKLHAGPREVLAAVQAVAAGRRAFPEGEPAAVAARQDPTGLTERELEVLDLVAAGYDNPAIAARIGVSENTVKSHLAHLYRKLGAENRVQLALHARTGPHA